MRSGWAASTASREWEVRRAMLGKSEGKWGDECAYTLQPAALPLRMPLGASSNTMPGMGEQRLRKRWD